MTRPIQVYSDLTIKAKELSNEADDLRRIYTNLRQDAAYWEKENGKSKDLDIFNEKFADVSSLINNFAGAVDDMSGALSRMAELYESGRKRAVARAGGIGAGLSGGISDIFSGGSGSVISGVVNGLLGMVGLGSVANAYNTIQSGLSALSQLQKNPESAVTTLASMAGLEDAAAVFQTAAETVNLLKNDDNTVSLPLAKKELFEEKYQKFLNQDNKISDTKIIKEYISDLEKLYGKTPNNLTGDILLPEDAEYVASINEHGEFSYIWDAGDGTVKDSRMIKQPKVGDIISRYGPPEGKTAAPLSENGGFYSTDDSSLPYRPNKNAHHQYRFREVLTESTLKQKIYHSKDLTFWQKSELLAEINDYYKPIENVPLPDGTTAEVMKLGTAQGYRPQDGIGPGEGLKYGQTAPQKFGREDFQTKGGGYEYKLPVSVNDLVTLGILEEIKK